MTTKDWLEQPPGVYGAAFALILLALIMLTGQQLLWLPFCALLASLLVAWVWPYWVLATLKLEANCLTPLRQGEIAQWQVSLHSQLPLWGLVLSGPLGLACSQFIPGRQAQLQLSAQPQLSGNQPGSWRCAVNYPFNLWHHSVQVYAADLAVMPALESIDYLPLTEPDPNPNLAQSRRALVCFDSSSEFALGEEANQTQLVQLKLLANLCRALAAHGYEVNLATSLGLLTAPAYSAGFCTLDETLLQALERPARAEDLLARYNPRPDAQLIVLPQWLSTAVAPELFAGQILWQLLFDEERFIHPLSRGRHFHRRLSAAHWQWVIEPQQPLARLFYVHQ
jgi:hypothetical protein